MDSTIAQPARRLIDQEVLDCEGNHLGELYDMVLHLPTGRIAYAVLSFGGSFMGWRNKLFAIPREFLSHEAGESGDEAIMTVGSSYMPPENNPKRRRDSTAPIGRRSRISVGWSRFTSTMNSGRSGSEPHHVPRLESVIARHADSQGGIIAPAWVDRAE